MYRAGQVIIIRSREEIDKTITEGTNYYRGTHGYVGWNKAMYEYCGMHALVVRAYHMGKEMLLSVDNQKFNWVDAWVRPAVVDNRRVRA